MKKLPFRGLCPTCQKSVYGRADKTFCSIECKNKHHACGRKLHKAVHGDHYDQISRNLIILEGALSRNGKTMIVHKSALKRRGYDFSCVTNIRRHEKELRIYLYHFEIRELKDGMVRVTRTIDRPSPNLPIFFRRWEMLFPLGEEIGGGVNSEIVKSTDRNFRGGG